MKTAYLMADDKTYPFKNSTERKRLLLGLCIRCGKVEAMPNVRTCLDCGEKMSATSRKYYARKKAARLQYATR
ncbi:MAG: hypothetical protein WC503_03000 [Candidatus Shapirobacteria bacterium]